MNNFDKNEKEKISDVPDFEKEKNGRDESWDEFSRMLWRLVNELDVSKLDLPEKEMPEPADEIDPVAPKNARQKDCLSFEKCQDVAAKTLLLSVTEKAHLKNCQYCEQRIAAFADVLPEFETEPEIAKPFEVFPESVEQRKKQWFTDYFQNATSAFRFNLPAAKFAAAGLIVISAIGLAIYWTQLETKRGAEDVVLNDPNTTKNSPNPNDNLQTQANEKSEIQTPVNSTNQIPTPEPTTPNNVVPNEKSGENPDSAELSKELAFLSNEERRSWQTGKIEISKDLAKLKEIPVTRTGKNASLFISPNNEATIETRPTLRWKNLENSEFKIIVQDQGLNEVAQSEVLGQNSWQINKELPAGFYFWKVLVRNKKTTEFVSIGDQAFLKIVGRAEKSRIEKAKNANASRLMIAILYARAGLLAEAEREINAELEKNPNSVKAKKMRAQVRGWRNK